MYHRDDLTVYRTTSPDVIKRWHDVNAAIQAWADTIKAALAEFGMDGRKIYYDQVSGRILGVAHNDDVETPAGWRADSKHYRLVPALSTKPGKAIGARLAELRRPDPRDLPGMPKHAWPGMSFLTVGFHLTDGAIYARWDKQIPEDGVDLTVWQRLKLSEYYRTLEDLEERERLIEAVVSP